MASVLSPLAMMTAFATLAIAQTTPAGPPLADDLRAALGQADAGQSEPLVRLADSGRGDAQAYAAILFIFGRGSIAADPPRGCAYAEKASTSQAAAMHLLGECYSRGLAGPRDVERAKAAFTRADAMGYPKSKCALGELLLLEPAQAARGLELCRAAAEAGDVAAQERVADIYRTGGPVRADPAQARRWYQKAVDANDPQAARKLGEMYNRAEGGRRDRKKALSLWQTAEKGGDPLAPILVADELFSDLTGGKKPGPGQFAFKGGIPVEEIKVIEDWYREALERDPRPEVKKRAQAALDVLGHFKTAANSTP